MSSNRKGPNPISRRNFLKTTVAKGGAGLAVAAAGLHPKGAEAADIKWDRSADVVVVGAGVSGLACACAARDAGASVIIIEENFDIGGRGIMSGGSIQLGGGHSLQKKYGTVDSADMIFADWTRHDHPSSRYSDRDIVRKFADENAATFEFLLAHGVQFTGREENGGGATTNAGRTYQTVEWHIPSQLVAPHRGRNGSGLVRRLEESARKAGVQILLKHSMTRIIRENPTSGRVVGITARFNGKDINVQGKKGVYVGTGGNPGNLNLRRTFDPRLTGSKTGVRPVPVQRRRLMSKAIGARFGHGTADLRGRRGDQQDDTHRVSVGVRSVGHRDRQPDLPSYPRDRPHRGQLARRDHGEPDRQAILERARRELQLHRRRDGVQRRSEQVERRRADLGHLRFRRGSPREVESTAAQCGSALFREWCDAEGTGGQHQQPVPEEADAGNGPAGDGRAVQLLRHVGCRQRLQEAPAMYKIEKPPFHAAWATPILHDSLTGLRVNTDQQVIDITVRSSRSLCEANPWVGWRSMALAGTSSLAASPDFTPEGNPQHQLTTRPARPARISELEPFRYRYFLPPSRTATA